MKERPAAGSGRSPETTAPRSSAVTVPERTDVFAGPLTTPSAPLAWMRAIRDAKATTSTKAVLLMLALRMRPDGAGFVSTRQLAVDASVSHSTVERATRWAREHRLLIQTRRGGRLGDGRVRASEWQLSTRQAGRTEPVLNPSAVTGRGESQRQISASTC
jgi:hypothetical protein